MSRELINRKTAAKSEQDIRWELTSKKTSIVKEWDMSWELTNESEICRDIRKNRACESLEIPSKLKDPHERKPQFSRKGNCIRFKQPL